MSVRSAMVDQMRTHRYDSDSRLVDGEPVDEDVVGPWIPCRLNTPSSSELRSDSNTGLTRDLSVMINPKDVNGDVIDIQDGDYIEIKSDSFDSTVLYDLMGVPSVVRAKKKIKLYSAALQIRTER